MPVLHGIKIAQTILDPASESIAALQAKTGDLEAEVLTRREILKNAGWIEGQYPLGMWIYDQLIGAESS